MGSNRLYAKRSTTHLIHLRDILNMISRGDIFVIDFPVTIKQIVDELATLDDLPSDADLIVYSTRVLDHAYKELTAAMRTHDSILPFE